MTEERKPRRSWTHPQLYLGLVLGMVWLRVSDWVWNALADAVTR